MRGSRPHRDDRPEFYVSLFVDCASDTEITALYGRLAESGQVLRPLDAQPFSRRFGRVCDRVSWQVDLPRA